MQTHKIEPCVYKILLRKYKHNELKQMASRLGIETKRLKKIDLIDAVMEKWCVDEEQKVTGRDNKTNQSSETTIVLELSNVTKANNKPSQPCGRLEGSNINHVGLNDTKHSHKADQPNSVKKGHKSEKVSKQSLIDHLLEKQTQTHKRATMQSLK